MWACTVSPVNEGVHLSRLRCDFSHKSLSENFYIVRYVLRVCKSGGDLDFVFSCGMWISLLNAHLTGQAKWKRMNGRWHGNCVAQAREGSGRHGAYRDTPEMQAGTLTRESVAALPCSGGRPGACLESSNTPDRPENSASRRPVKLAKWLQCFVFFFSSQSLMATVKGYSST